jgi:ATP-binding cassette subfamily F protein 3
MILLSARNIRKHFGPEPVLADVSFDIRPGERISLVGPNGAGKTTLLRILAGLEEADAGEVNMHSGARLGFLEQQPQFDPSHTVWDEARASLEELLKLADDAEVVARQIAAAEDDEERRRLGDRFDRLQQELHQRDAYAIDHKIERVLAGLGFTPAAFRQRVIELSGGQQNRLLLAKLLLAEPDVMLLDEPSNHLDIEATAWLEDYLAASQQALLLVSHDRYFLDKTSNRTLELVRGEVDSLTGNFSAYWRQKAERLEVQQRTFERQQIEIAKLEDFIRRNHYGQKHAQAEDRRKKLEKIERVALPREIAAPPMRFPEASRTGDIVLRVEHLSKSYDRPLFQDLTFDVLRGQKWGVLGPNGCGKTTLLRCILGRVAADEGRAIFGSGVVPGYFDQLLHCVDGAAEVLEAIRPPHKEFVTQQRRDLLAKFGVTGDMVFQRVDSLSGGERNRTALAFMAALDPNLLILDEPTNHLDLWARAALEKALVEFDGTVLFVSHDRYFLNQVADHLLMVEPGGFRVIEGNYETYLHLVKQGFAAEATSGGVAAKGPAPSKPSENGEKKGRREKPVKPKRKFPYRKLADIEVDIAARESEIESLHAALASPETLRDGVKVKQATAALEEAQSRLAQLMEHWEEAHELN